MSLEPHGQEPVEQRVTGDGIIEVRTSDADPHLAELRAKEDAELQRALEEYRGCGVTHPALFVLHPGGRHAGRLAAAVVAAGGTAVWSSRPEVRLYMLALDEARAILGAAFGPRAKRLFRVPRWPAGYWTVEAAPDEIRFYESRSWKDAGGQRGPGGASSN